MLVGIREGQRVGKVNKKGVWLKSWGAAVWRHDVWRSVVPHKCSP